MGVRGRQWVDAVAWCPRTVLTAAADPARGSYDGLDVAVHPTLDVALDGTDVDAIILATPPESHLEGVRAACERGVPVLCEKPLAESFDQAAEIVGIAEHAGVPLLVGMNFRYLASTLRIREMLKQGRLGAPMFSVFTYLRNRDGTRPDLNSYPLVMDHPMLIEQSIHHLDLLRFAYDREVESVIADSWNPPTSDYRGDAAVALILRLEGGPRVVYIGTWVSGSNRFDFRWRTDCTEGVIVQVRQAGKVSSSVRVPGGGLTGARFNMSAEPLIPDQLPADEFLVHDTRRLLEHFVDVVAGTVEPGPSGRDHLRTVALLDATLCAARTGRRIDVKAHLERLEIREEIG